MSKKLIGSKWTAVEPENKEKHFVVTQVEYRKDGSVATCQLEAVMTKQKRQVDWRELNSDWLSGWK